MNALLAALEAQRPAVRRLLAARVGAADAEDLLQELYLSVAAIDDPEAVRDPPAFLFRLAFNLASSRRRSDARRVRREQDWVREGADLAADVAVSPEPPADEAVVSRQELARVFSALRTLPPRTQEVFEMHKLRGLSYAEVATALEVSRSAVEKHMMRALAVLARARVR